MGDHDMLDLKKGEEEPDTKRIGRPPGSKNVSKTKKKVAKKSKK